MNIQPITDYRCCRTTNCTHDKGKTPPNVSIPKPPIEVKNQDKFVRSDKIVPKNNDNRRKIGVMFSSGGGTN